LWAYQAITGGRDDSAIANRALSACGHVGRCGLNGRIQIVAGTSLDATMTETNSLPAECERDVGCVRSRSTYLMEVLGHSQLARTTNLYST